jgi:DNA polymerase-3 subunit gamma/tau
VVARLSRSGRDAGQFLRDLEMHARELLVVQTLGEVPPELRVTDDRDERLAEQAGRVGRAEVVRLLDLLANGLEAIKNGSEPRTQLELALVKAAAPDVDASTRALLTRVERLEAQLAQSGGDDEARPVRAVGKPLPDVPAPPPAPPVESAAPATGAAAVAVAIEADQPEEEPFDLDAMRLLWPAVLDTVREQNSMLAALLDGGRPIALARDELTVAFSESRAFLKRKAEDAPNIEALAGAIQTVSGHVVRLAYELRPDDGEEPVASPKLSDEELVKHFLEEFDAEELPEEERQA